MTAAPNDEAALRGLVILLETRRRKLESGSEPLGWKVGLGGPAALEMLGISRPLVGCLMHENLLPSGTRVLLTDWTKPVAEPEICVTMGADLPGGGNRDAAAAIAGVGPAIELSDVVVPPENPEKIVAANINHRHVVLGECDRSRAGARLDGLVGRVVSGNRTTEVDDLEANTGKLVDIVRNVADMLAEAGTMLRAHEVIIAGSVTPPIFLETRRPIFRKPKEQVVSFELVGLDAVSVGLI